MMERKSLSHILAVYLMILIDIIILTEQIFMDMAKQKKKL